MIFEYTARTPEGLEKSGTIDARDESAAVGELSARGLWVSKVAPRTPAAWGDVNLGWPGGVPARVFGAFLVQLAVMIRSGVTLVEALASLEAGEEHRRFRRVIADVRAEVESGRAFSQALATHPEVFDPFFVSMVKVGEAGGLLEKVLIKLSAMQQRQQALRNQVLGSLAYPAFLVAVATTVLAILLGFALPRFAAVFASARFPLPAPTRLLLALGQFVEGHIAWVVGIALAGAALAAAALLTRVGRRVTGEAAWRVPVLGQVVRLYLVVHVAETVSMLLAAGVPLLELLAAVEATIALPTARGVLAQMRSFVERGSTLRLALEQNPLFPPMAVKLIETGEKTGNLERMFTEIATYYDDQLQNALKAALALLEPMLIVGMAVLVGLIMLAVILPIMQMTQVFRGRA